ncbi:MAG TPA: TetR/AcrR family transcriptional regulator [Marmoricola sp.]|nr:TetR/AcrR family transcriptional regulator [Marmoricola sp.]
MVPQLRPRVEGDREDEILEATLELLIELGYHRLTLDAVARKARASKATLYRRWESKPALVIDALIKAKDMPDPELPNTGSLRGDLISTFCGANGMANSRATEVLGAVITAVSTDDEFARLFRERFIGPKLAVTEEIYAHAIERGEISPDIDLEIIGPALAGVCLHRAYLMGTPPDEELITRVIDHLIIPAATHGAPVQAS